MFPKRVLTPRLWVFLFLLPFVHHCGSMGKTAVKSSQDRQDPSDRGPRVAYAPLTGKMDGVEFFINQELMRNGLVAEERLEMGGLPELKSIFETDAKLWRPSLKDTIPIERNAMVNKWIAAFTGPLRKNYARWLGRAGMYAPVMEGIMKQYGLPPDLIYLAMIESGFNMHAYSHAHAAGPWQFIRSTGKMYGLKSSGVVDERRDLLKATHAAAAHLRDLYRNYQDWYLAFAAYNAGAGKVNHAIKRMGTKDYWKLAGPQSRYLRNETKNYVPKILAAAIIAKNYRKYGFSARSIQKPLSFDVVTVAHATDLEVLAHCAGTKVEAIKFLNPSLYLGVSPPGERYTVLIPKGREKEFKKRYGRIPAKERSRYVFHQVKGRSTLDGVAKQHHVPIKELALANHLKLNAKLYAGQTLVVPTKMKRRLKDAPLDDQVPEVLVAEVEAVTSDEPELDVAEIIEEEAGLTEDGVLAGSSKEGLHPPSAYQYKVRKGDTLGAIAKKHNLYVKALKEWNRLGPQGRIRVGQVLRLAAPDQPKRMTDEPEFKPILASASKSHRVVPGDTLSEIARRHGVSLKKLKDWNSFEDTTVIKPGQLLALEPRVSETASDVDGGVKLAANFWAYRVKQGDTLVSIARIHNMSVSDLGQVNGLGEGATLTPGQMIKVYPPKPRATTASAKVEGEELPKGATPSPDKKTQDRMIIHAVRHGENLWDIARKYRVTVDQLKQWNGLKSNQIKPNQKIIIYARSHSARIIPAA